MLFIAPVFLIIQKRRDFCYLLLDLSDKLVYYSTQQKDGEEGGPGLREINLKDTLLTIHQMSTYCTEIGSFAGQAFDKHFLLEALQRKPSSTSEQGKDKEKEKDK